MPTATIYPIQAHVRARAGVPTRRDDFDLGPGHPYDAARILTDPAITIYGLDSAAREVLFVELPSTFGADDLAGAPFFHLLQSQNARSLITIPFDDFIALADRLETDLARVVWLFNIGRCGSTLLHHVFNRVDNVICLSEPDALSQLTYMRDRPAAENDALARAIMKVLFTPTLFPVSTNRASTKVVKFRNQNVETIELFHRALPHAKILFLYRDAVGWCNSLTRVILRTGPAFLMALEESLAWLTHHHGRSIDLAALGLENLHGPLTLAERLALSWLIMMDRFLQVPQEIPMLVCRYDQLNERRNATLERIFEYCDLPPDAVPAALAAFEQDSQAGTHLAQSRVANVQLTDEDMTRIQSILRHHPVIHSPDFETPNTLQLPR